MNICKRILHLISRGWDHFQKIVMHPRQALLRYRFIVSINRECRHIGMNNTRLFNASGASSFSKSTPHDLLLLLLHVHHSPKICEICGMPYDEIQINGTPTRIESNFFNSDDYRKNTRYHVLYAKTGSWGNAHKSIVARVLVNGEAFDIAVMAEDEFCFQNINGIVSDIIDQAIGISPLSLQFLPGFLRCGGGYCAVYKNKVYQHNEQKRFLLASVTKLITAACLLEEKLSGMVKINELDVLPSGGIQLRVSDEISFEDAMKLMLIESSNTAAEALGRICGEKMPQHRQ